MTQSNFQIVANCLNPKCAKPIKSNHPYSWCSECGNPLPQEIQNQLGKLQEVLIEAKSTDSAMSEDLNSVLGIKSQSPQESITQAAQVQRASPGVESPITSSMMSRYRDAYNVARVIVGIGSFIKGLGIVLAILIALGGFIAASQTRIEMQSLFLGLGGILWAGIVGVCFYIGGVLISVQGQILKASLDGAVNSSPFLSDEHKAKVMSLI